MEPRNHVFNQLPERLLCRWFTATLREIRTNLTSAYSPPESEKGRGGDLGLEGEEGSLLLGA